MKRLMPVARATSAWLAMGWLAGCGGTTPSAQENAPQSQTRALEEYGPDLVVTEVKAPPSLRAGQSFTATVEVCNRGSAPATTYYAWPVVELYLSLDESLSLPAPNAPMPTDQQMVGSVQVPPLDPGQCTRQTLQGYASLPPDAQGDGAYYLGAIADVYQVLTESDEANNAYVAGRVGVGSRSDLVVTDISAPASARPGDAFTARVTVCNQGTESTNNPTQPMLELYLSLDDSLTSPGAPTVGDQRKVGSLYLPPLYAGQCVTREVNAYAGLPPDAQADGALYLGAIVDPYQQEPELREDNNAFVAGKLGVGLRPDLVVTELKGPTSVRHGDSFMATVKVCNQGTEPNSAYNTSLVELYLSVDDSIVAPPTEPGTPFPTDQRVVGEVDVPWLAPGQCATRTVNASAWLPPDAQGDGAYYFGAIVDAFQMEPELREDNNTYVAGKLGVGYRPDLVVTEVSGPASVRHGDSFTARVTVCNQGTESTSGWYGSQVELYLSMDTALTPPVMSGPATPPPADQALIGTLSVPPLYAGQCMTRDVQAYASIPPAAMNDGAFYLAAIADAYQQEPELREDNNLLVGGLIGVGHRPDLVVTRISAPASVQHGNSFTATVKVCNQGTEPTYGYYNQAVLELYLSMDTALTVPQQGSPGSPLPSDQRMVGSVDVPWLQAGQCVDRPVNAYAYVPPEAPPDGAYYLAAVVDAYQHEQELREDNNVFIGGLMGVGYRADLVVTEVRAPASVQNGNSFTASVTVCNQGTQPTSGWNGPYVELYLSMDTTLVAPQQGSPGMPPPTDQHLVGSLQFPPLSQGQCVTRDVNAAAWRPPDAQGDGAFYIGALVDPMQYEPELREDNNITVGGLIGVGSRSDLVVTEVKGPTSVRHGDNFTATVTVCNQGTQPTSAWYGSQVELYLSMDTVLTPPQTSGPPAPPPGDQTLIGTQSFPSLYPGQCESVPVNAYAGMPPEAMGDGALYLAAIVDPYQQELELREDNNITVGSLMGVGYRPDLVVTQVSAPANVRPHDAFTARVTVCNQGTEATNGWYGGPRVELYLSMDTELTPPMSSYPNPPDQQMVGTLDLPPLGPGQCVTRDVSASAYPPPAFQGDGALYLAAIVDPVQAELELREDNNTFIAGKLGVGYRPDLVVTQVSGPASVRPGDTFTAAVKVCNQGTEPSMSPWSYVELYLSMDTTLVSPAMVDPGPMPTDQRTIAAVDLPALQPGQCVTRELNAPAHLPPDAQGDGAYYLGAIADAYLSVPELREDNNITVGSLIGVGHLPDLVITEVTGPASVRPGDSFTATVKVCNQGTAQSGYSSWPQLELYLSMDDMLSLPPNSGPYLADQQMVASEGLQPLEPGECTTRTLNAYASFPPAAQPDSVLYLGAIVDVYASVQELREDNNATVGGRMGVGHRPDLVVTEVSSPASVRPGDAFTATVKVCNQGTESSGGFSPAPARLELFQTVSESLVLPGPGVPYPPEGQQLLGGVDVAPLSAGQCVTLSVPAYAGPVPGAMNTTAFHLAAVVDAYQVELELREDNNVHFSGLMGVGNASDLVVTEVSGPTSVQRGQPFTATVKACNQGTEPSSSSARLEVYLSTDGALVMPGTGPLPPPSSQSLVGSVDVQPLAAGQCATLSVPASGNAPPDMMMDGAVSLGAIIDAGQYVSELREDNNATVGGLIGVGNLPDLVVTSVSGPASVQNNGAFTAIVEVCNQGTTQSGSPYGSDLELYLSMDTTLSPMGPGPMPMDQTPLASVQVSPLAPGQCVTLSVPASAYLPPAAQGPGSYYLGAWVDAYRNEQELREDNNARADHAFAVTF